MLKQSTALAAAVVLALGGTALPAPAAPAAAPQEITGFGTNPGNLRMFRQVPAGLPTGRPLVVALHGCTQSAAAYDDEPGWTELADRHQFSLLLPQQQSANNANSCFNWFETGDTTRGSGEALSIKQMVDRMRDDLGVDPRRVYVTGLSAGGAMTAAMLATYPDVFDGGAVVAGLPYRCATSVVEAFGCMNPGKDLTPRQWGDKVRAASGSTGGRPTLSVWHGTSDSTVAHRNLTELADQWTDVHGTDQTPDASDTVDGYPHQVFEDSTGRPVVETWSITGMGHGQPVDPGTGTANCGTTAPYILDVGICAAHRIAQFWGLAGDAPPAPATTTLANVAGQDGYTKAAADGSGAVVGTLSDLATGRGVDGKHNRTLLSFDTSALPAGTTISRAWLTVTYASSSGDPWTDPAGNRLTADVRTGCFGGCGIEASDWAAAPTAAGVAQIPRFTSGTAQSTELSPAGLAAINRNGTTQVRLRFEQPQTGTAYLFVERGAQATLSMAY